ncbi:VCBS repeat-containing protein [Mycobacterium sp. MAA66]|uniref:beta strand repeat-containing protein n=1 Tax=Mycobacterium sp. MAA66 TaxID=3156297 RepID=UPI003516B04D
MAATHRSTNSSHGSGRKKGAHRVAPKPARQPYNWLGVGAMTIGLGAAMASGTGIANAKGGASAASSTSSNNNTSPGSASTGAKHTDDAKQHDGSTPKKHDKTKPTAATATDTTTSDATTTADPTKVTGKGKKSKTGQPKPAAPTAATQTPATTPTPTAATTAKTSSTTATTKTVALAAVTPAATTDSSTATTTTAHATSSNPIIAAIQNALISFFTAPATISQLAANGLTGPVAPSTLLNPVGAFLYGIFRGIEDFAGLVPHTGTPTTTSNPANGTVTGTLGFTEPAGAQLTYTVATNPLFGSVTVAADGSYTYKSNILGSALSALGLNPTDTFTVTASTGIAATNVTVTVPVTAANDSPSTPTSINQVANAVTGVVTGTLSSTAPDGQAVTYSVLTNPLQGSVSLNSSSGVTTFTYTPTELARIAANGTSLITGLNTDVFTVTATSAGGTTSLPGIITVPIEPATGDTPSTPTAINVNANAASGLVTGTITSTDPAGQPLTYSVLTGTLLGSVTVNSTTGAFTYTPSTAARIAANPILGISVVNTDAFTVTASNGTYSSTALITVPIEPATGDTPSTPTAINVNANAASGLVTGTITSTDPAGQPLTYSVLTGTLLGSVTVNSTTGAFTYTPSTAARIAANPILGISVVNTDAFTVTASNGTYSSTALITVPIEPATGDTPSTPTATNISTNTSTGVVTGTLVSTSPDGGTVTYSVLSLPTQGTVNVSGSTFTYTPSTLAQLEASLGLTTDTFGVTATNAAGYTSGIGTVSVTVQPIATILDTPSSPTSNNQHANTITGVITGTVSATDPAGAPLTYSVLTGPIGGTLTLNSTTGAYTYTPSSAARTAANPILGISVVNTDTFTVVASNGTFSSILPGLITVPIEPAANDTPTTPAAGNQSQNIYSGVVTGTISSTSPDGGAVNYSVSSNVLLGGQSALGGSVTLNTTGGVTSYTYTPTVTARNNADLGIITTDSFTLTATNAAGYSSSTTVTVPISPGTNDTPSTPVSTNQNQNLASGVVTGTLSSTSPDGGAVTYTVNIGTLLGALTVNSTTGAFTYTPSTTARTAANPILGVSVVNTDTFTVTASNSSGYSHTNIITVPISPATNDTPSGSATSAHGNHVTTGVVSGASPDGTTVSYSASTLGGSVTVNPTTGAYTFTDGYVGIYPIGTYVGGIVTFTVTNTSGFSSSWTVTFGA